MIFQIIKEPLEPMMYHGKMEYPKSFLFPPFSFLYLSNQFAEEFTKDCQTLSKEEGQVLPKDFNASSMFDTFMNIKMVPDMLNAVSVLKQNGNMGLVS